MSLERFAYGCPSTRTEKEADVRFGVFRNTDKELVEYSSDSGSDNELNQFVAKFSRGPDRISERVRNSDYGSSRLQSRHHEDLFPYRSSSSEVVGDSYRFRNTGVPSFKTRPSSPVPGDNDSYEEEFLENTSKRSDTNLDSKGLPRYYIPDPNDNPLSLSSYTDPYYGRDNESMRRWKADSKYNEYIEDDKLNPRSKPFHGESSQSQRLSDSDYYRSRFKERYEYDIYSKPISPSSKEKFPYKRSYDDLYESDIRAERVSRPAAPTPEVEMGYESRKKFCGDTDLRSSPRFLSDFGEGTSGLKEQEKLFGKDKPYLFEEQGNTSYPEKSSYSRKFDSQEKEKLYGKDKLYPQGDLSNTNYPEKSDFSRKYDIQEKEIYSQKDQSNIHFSEKGDFSRKYNSHEQEKSFNKDKLYSQEDRSIASYSDKDYFGGKYDSRGQEKFHYKEKTREDQNIKNYSEKSDSRNYESREREKFYSKDKLYSREDQNIRSYSEKSDFSRYDSQDVDKNRGKKYREDKESHYYEDSQDSSKLEHFSKSREHVIQGKLSFDVDREMGPPAKKRSAKRKERSPSLERRGWTSPPRRKKSDSPASNLYRRSPERGYEYNRRMSETKRREEESSLWAERRTDKYPVKGRSEERIASDLDDMIPPPPPPPILSGLLHTSPPPFQPTDYSQPLPHVSRLNNPENSDYFQATPSIVRDPTKVEIIKKKIKESYIKKKASKGTFFPVSRNYRLSDNISPIIFTNFCSLNYNKTKQPKTVIWESKSVRLLKMKGDPNYQKKDTVIRSEKNTQGAVLEKELSLGEPREKNKEEFKTSKEEFKTSKEELKKNKEELKTIPCIVPSPSIESNQSAGTSATKEVTKSNIQSTPNTYNTFTPSYQPVQQNQLQNYFTRKLFISQAQTYFPQTVATVAKYYSNQISSLLNYVNYNPPVTMNPVFQSNANVVNPVYQTPAVVPTNPVIPAPEFSGATNWNSWNPKLNYPPPLMYPKVSPPIVNNKEKNKQIQSNTNLIVCNNKTFSSENRSSTTTKNLNMSSENRSSTTTKNLNMSSENRSFTTTKNLNMNSETRNDNRSLITIPINNPITSSPNTNLNLTKGHHKHKKVSHQSVETKDDDDDVVFVSETYVSKHKGDSDIDVNMDNLMKIMKEKESKVKSSQNKKPVYSSVQEVIHDLKSSKLEPNEAKGISNIKNPPKEKNISTSKIDNAHSIKKPLKESIPSVIQSPATSKSNAANSQQIKNIGLKHDNMKTDNPTCGKLNLNNDRTPELHGGNHASSSGSICSTSENLNNSKIIQSFENKESTYESPKPVEKSFPDGVAPETVGDLNKPLIEKIITHSPTQKTPELCDPTDVEPKIASKIIQSVESVEPKSTLTVEKPVASSNNEKPKVASNKESEDPSNNEKSKASSSNESEDSSSNEKSKAASNDETRAQPLEIASKESVSIIDNYESESLENKILIDNKVDLLQKIPLNMFEGQSELTTKITEVQSKKPSLCNILKALRSGSSYYRNYFIYNEMLCFKFRVTDKPLIVTDCIGDEILSLLHNFMHGVSIETFLDFYQKNFCEIREAAKKFENLTKSCGMCFKLKKDSGNNCEPAQEDKEEKKQNTDKSCSILDKVKLAQSLSKTVQQISEQIKKKETDEYFFKGDLLLKKCFINENRELKIFLPDDKIDDIVKIYHCESLNHGPEDKVLNILKKHFSPVNNLLSFIKSYINNCEVCKGK